MSSDDKKKQPECEVPDSAKRRMFWVMFALGAAAFVGAIIWSLAH